MLALSQHPLQFDGPQTAPWQAPPKQATPFGHAWHALPPVPHAAVVSAVWQLPFPSQQPLAQLPGPHVTVEMHVPALQVPIPQSMHDSPPTPHACGPAPPRHMETGPPILWQQPAQLPGPQGGAMHWPPTHSSPGPHMAHCAPPTPQRLG